MGIIVLEPIEREMGSCNNQLYMFFLVTLIKALLNQKVSQYFDHGIEFCKPGTATFKTRHLAGIIRKL